MGRIPFCDIKSETHNAEDVKSEYTYIHYGC